MARIEDCTLGARVKLTDGWGGPASVIGRRMNNRVEGSLAHTIQPGQSDRMFPDIVLMQFEAPVWDGPHHKILAFSCLSEELTLL